MDDLHFSSELCAIPEGATPPENFRGEVLIIQTNESHLGFARLRRSCKNSNAFYVVPSHLQQNGPARSFDVIERKGASDIFFKAIQIDPDLTRFDKLTYDEVYAVACPYWPSQAAEWRTRKRTKGWPPASVIDQITKGGCHLVAKPHHSNPFDNTEWRFSFSLAELILVHTLTDVQKYIYHILRLVKHEVNKKGGRSDEKVLHTYYFKTLMLWACEQKPLEFWNEIHIESSVRELLCNMTEWLIDRTCPHYFIPENNIMDHLTDECAEEIQHLMQHAEGKIRTVLKCVPKAMSERAECFTFSHKIMLFCLLALNMSVFINPFSSKLRRYWDENLVHNALFCSEVKALFSGLSIHLSLMSGRKYIYDRCRKNLVITAKRHFSDSLSDIKKEETLVVFNKSIHHTMLRNLADKRHMPNTIAATVLESSGVSIKQLHRYNELFQMILSAVDSNNKSPSYYISSAYTANFFYTGLREYTQALNVCHESLAYFRDGNRGFGLDIRFCEAVLGVVLSRKWLPIFDESIQIVFGFAVLCEAMVRAFEFHTPYQTSIKMPSSGGIRKSACLRVEIKPELIVRLSPIHFLEYIQTRCGRYLRLSNAYSFEFVGAFYFQEEDMHRKRLSAYFLTAAASIL